MLKKRIKTIKIVKFLCFLWYFLLKTCFFDIFVESLPKFGSKSIKNTQNKEKMLLLIGFWLKNYTNLFKKDKNQWFLLIFCIFLLKLTINFSKLFNFLLFAQFKP
jgi:hypothetical protein